MRYFSCIVVFSAVCILNCLCRPTILEIPTDDDAQQHPGYKNVNLAVFTSNKNMRRSRREEYIGEGEHYAGSTLYKIVPYLNTGSASLKGDNTHIKATVHNYGYHDFPEYLLHNPYYYRPALQQWYQNQEEN